MLEKEIVHIFWFVHFQTVAPSGVLLRVNRELGWIVRGSINKNMKKDNGTHLSNTKNKINGLHASRSYISPTERQASKAI